MLSNKYICEPATLTKRSHDHCTMQACIYTPLQRIASGKEVPPFPGSTPKRKSGWSLGIITHTGSIVCIYAGPVEAQMSLFVYERRTLTLIFFWFRLYQNRSLTG